MYEKGLALCALLTYFAPISANPIAKDDSFLMATTASSVKFRTFSDSKCSSNLVAKHVPKTANVCHIFKDNEHSLTIDSSANGCRLYVYNDSKCTSGQYPKKGYKTLAPACHVIGPHRYYKVLCGSTSTTSSSATFPTVSGERARDVEQMQERDENESEYGEEADQASETLDLGEWEGNSTSATVDDEDVDSLRETDVAADYSLSKRVPIPARGVHCQGFTPRDSKTYPLSSIHRALEIGVGLKNANREMISRNGKSYPASIRNRRIAGGECATAPPNVDVVEFPIRPNPGFQNGEDQGPDRVMFAYNPRNGAWVYCSSQTHRGLCDNAFKPCGPA